MGRRFEPRYPAAEPVQVSWHGGSTSAELRDFSRSGARIASSKAIPVETIVTISVQGSEIKARVVTSVRRSSVHIIGVELLPEFQGLLKRKT